MAVGVSKVTIANLALSSLNARSRIDALTEDSKEAEQVNLWYDISRQQALEDFNWSFARKRQLLALNAEAAPTDLWNFRYTYPADCLIMREVVNPLGPDADAVPFKVEMDSTGQFKTILTDVEDATALYTFDQEQVASFTLYFVKTLSYLLAHNMAMSITGKVAVQDRMLDRYLMFVANAQAADAQESMAKPAREGESVRARR